ncbi:MAG TPA: hypothetical protein VF499_12510 [Afipia sp.]
MSVNIVDETEEHIDVSITDDDGQPAVVIAEGMWWARDRRDGATTIIRVRTSDEAYGLEPDDDDCGILLGCVMGNDYEERVYNLHSHIHGLMCWYDFICLIAPPDATFVDKAIEAGGKPGRQRQNAPEWFDWSKA